MYPLLMRDNLMIPIQVKFQFRFKKLFLIYLPLFWNLDWIWNILTQNMTLIDILLPIQLTWQWSMNIIKVLWCRFQQCSGAFTMLLLEGFSQTRLFRHLSGYDFAVRNFKITKSMRVSFLSKCSKLHRDFKIDARNSEKGFYFWDNYMWIGIVKLSLKWRGYFSWAANVLTSSSKICHVNKEDCLQLN